MITYIDNDTSITLDGMSIPKDGGNRHYAEFLELLADGEAELVQPAGPTLAETVAARTTEAAAACSAVLAPLRARFAAGEELTWQAQLAEANALLSNPALAVVPEPGTEEARTWVDPIPTIRGIVAVTGEDIGAFSEAVRCNNETWTAATTYCIGQRQRFVAAIKAVAAAEGATVADVLAVPLEIALPG